MKYQAPKGTRDLIDQDFCEFDYVAKTILNVLSTYAYKQVRTPNFETLELLQKDSGNEMLEQIYRFEDRSGREFGLKSDVTPAIARIISQIGASAIRPIKLCAYDRVYRYERPQSGRYREITQINAEMFGTDKPISDAEVIGALIDCYEALEFYDFKVVIGYRPLLVEFLGVIGVKESELLEVIRIIDKKKKITDEQFEQDLKDIDPTLDMGIILELTELRGNPRKVLERARNFFTQNEPIQRYLSNLSDIVDELELNGKIKYCESDFGLARGSAYYTGVIFEAVSTVKDDYGSIGAGGRYDSLVEMYGGKDIPAVGFSIGIDRLVLLLKNLGKLENIGSQNKLDYYIAFEKDQKSKELAYALAKKLRREGKRIEIDLLDKNTSEQLEIAKKKSDFCILVKEQLTESNQYKVIDFREGSEAVGKFKDGGLN